MSRQTDEIHLLSAQIDVQDAAALCAICYEKQPLLMGKMSLQNLSLAWKASGVGVWGSLRAIQKKDFSFKGCIQNSCMLWGPVQRQKFEKKAWDRPTC